MGLRSIKNILTTQRFYLVSSIIVVLFVFGYFFDPLFLGAKILLSFFVVVLIFDLSLLFISKNNMIMLTRELPERFSNGDESTVPIYIKNNYIFPVSASIIEELPSQFQIRNFEMKLKLKPFEEKILEYQLKPLERGDYIFGTTNVYITTQIGFWSRRYTYGASSTAVGVYPSFLKMKKYELLAISNRLTEVGIKRVRQRGTHSEFDQIKDYVIGDNYRTINWNATARRSKLMVNQYQEERSQQVYNIIDMGRTMEMPFEGMTLLDYAINSALILSNTSLLKHDKAGLITFNKSIETFLPAERKNGTIAKILELLYKQETLFAESDFALLAAHARRRITHRSLLIVYTNFETLTSLNRQMPYFRHLASHHLLLVVVFENSEIKVASKKEAHTLEEIYVKTIAEKFIHEKKRVVKELQKNGIMAFLTKPQHLTTNLINHYLELKNSGKF